MKNLLDLSHQRCGAIFFPALILVAISILLLPAYAAPITAYISTEPSTDLPMTAASYEQQGMALMAAHENARLIALMDEGLALYPDDAELMCLKAYALRKTGHFQESVDLLNEAIPLDPRPARYVNRGYGLLAMGKTEEALDDADKAITMNTSYSQGHGLKAEVLLAMGNFTGALQEADAALALEPGAAHYWHVRGTILDRKGDCNGALESLHTSIDLNNEYDMPWPGIPNASVDLARVEGRCSTPGTTPAPTKAALPAILVIAGIGIVVGLKRR